MSIVNKVLIGLSVCNCILSVLAVRLFQKGLKKRKSLTEYEEAYADAYKKSRIELSLSDLLQVIKSSESIGVDNRQQVIHVKGTRKSQNIETEIA